MWSEDPKRKPVSVSSDVQRTVLHTWRPEYRSDDARRIERIRRAATKHGRYSKEALAEHRQVQRLLKECRGVMAGLCDIVRDDPPTDPSLSLTGADASLLR